jgi:hypothetical protein
LPERSGGSKQDEWGLSEVDVASDSVFTRLVNQSNQRSPLRRSILSPDQDDQSAMWLPLCQVEEIVAIATNQHAAVSRSVFKHLFVPGGRIENRWQPNHLVTKFRKKTGNVDGNVVVQKKPQASGAICRAIRRSISPR